MMFEHDALKLLIQTAQEAAGAVVHKIDGDPDVVMVSHGGSHEFREMPPRHRDHRAETLEAFAAAVNEFAQPDPASDFRPSVWHNHERLVAVLDVERRERVTLALVQSQEFATLSGLCKCGMVDQKGLVRLLRYDLAGAVPADVVTAFRRMEFKRRSDGAGTVQHGKESLGRSIEAIVTGTADLPETVVASVPVYANHDLLPWRFDVALSVEIMPAEERFAVKPEPNALVRAVNAAQQRIAEELAGMLPDAMIAWGTP